MNTGPGLFGDAEVENRFVRPNFRPRQRWCWKTGARRLRGGQIIARHDADLPILDVNHPLTDGARYTQPQQITGIWISHRQYRERVGS